MGKSLSNKYGQKRLDSAKKIYNICNEKSIKKNNSETAEATGDWIGNKIADKITSISEKPAKELYNNDETEVDAEITTHKKRYVSPEER